MLQLAHSPMLSMLNALSEVPRVNFIKESDSFGAERFGVCVWQEESRYVIRAELPGVKKQDVSLQAKDQVVSIEAKQEAFMPQGVKVWVQEYLPQKSISHQIRLPADAQMTEVKAKLEDGILMVEVAKKVPEQKSIEIL